MYPGKGTEVVSSSEACISVPANSLTTGRGMYIETTGLNTGSSLNINGGTSASTGSALIVSQNSDNHSLRNVMSIIQDSSSAQKPTGLFIDMNTNTLDGADARALKIDSEQKVGKVVEIDATEITTGEGMFIQTTDLDNWKFIKHRWRYIRDNWFCLSSFTKFRRQYSQNVIQHTIKWLRSS